MHKESGNSDIERLLNEIAQIKTQMSELEREYRELLKTLLGAEKEQKIKIRRELEKIKNKQEKLIKDLTQKQAAIGGLSSSRS